MKQYLVSETPTNIKRYGGKGDAIVVIHNEQGDAVTYEVYTSGHRGPIYIGRWLADAIEATELDRYGVAELFIDGFEYLELTNPSVSLHEEKQ